METLLCPAMRARDPVAIGTRRTDAYADYKIIKGSEAPIATCNIPRCLFYLLHRSFFRNKLLIRVHGSAHSLDPRTRT